MGGIKGASSSGDDNGSNIDGDRQSRTTSSDQALFPGAGDQDAGGWRDEKERLLDRLFAWKAGEAWREVVLVCGAAEGRGGCGGIRSACELEVRDSAKKNRSLKLIDRVDGFDHVIVQEVSVSPRLPGRTVPELEEYAHKTTKRNPPFYI